MSNLPTLTTVPDMMIMAQNVAESKLFGIKTKQEAMALMLIAQAEGSHPAIAIRDYHIIQGKPALKADAMFARFQAAGGRVEWDILTDTKVSAKFSHPQGGSAAIDWDMDRAKKAGLGTKDMWLKYPRQMLRSRVISEGIRTVFPGVIIGAYTPEEVSDFEETPRQPYNGKTIDNEPSQEKPNLSMALDRGQQEQIYDECLAKINGAADLNTLIAIWTPYSKTIKTLDEDLRVDLIQKKDEAKDELTKAVSGLDAKLSRAEELVNA